MNQMNQPLVSVLISSYNHDKYIEDCLESLFNQTYPNFEVIIRDDGSTDNTVKKIKSFISSLNLNTIIVTEYGTNIGLIKSINWMLEKAKGEIIQGCASDDILMPDKLKRVVELFNNFPEIDLLFSDAEIIDANGKTLNRSYSKRNGHYFFESFSKDIDKNTSIIQDLDIKRVINSAFAGVGFSFRRRLLQCHNYKFPEMLKYEDNYLTFLGLVNRGIIVSKERLTKYRRHGLNFSSFNKISKDEIIKDEAKLCKWNLTIDYAKLNYLKKKLPVNSIFQSKRRKMIFLVKQNQLKNRMVIKLSENESYFFYWLQLFCYLLLGPKNFSSLKYLFYGISRKRFSNFLEKLYRSRKAVLM